MDVELYCVSLYAAGYDLKIFISFTRTRPQEGIGENRKYFLGSGLKTVLGHQKADIAGLEFWQPVN